MGKWDPIPLKTLGDLAHFRIIPQKVKETQYLSSVVSHWLRVMFWDFWPDSEARKCPQRDAGRVQQAQEPLPLTSGTDRECSCGIVSIRYITYLS